MIFHFTMDIAYSVHAPRNKTLAGSYFILFALTKYWCYLTIKTPLPAVCEHSYATHGFSFRHIGNFQKSQCGYLVSLPSRKEKNFLPLWWSSWNIFPFTAVNLLPQNFIFMSLILMLSLSRANTSSLTLIEQLTVLFTIFEK